MKNNSMSSEDRERFLKIVLNSTENLEKLVADLFELSKLESEKVALKLDYMNLSELVQDVSSRFKIMAENKEIDFHINATERGMVQIDVALMDRVIQNLLENAIKFTPKGGAVKINVVKSQGVFKLSVKDSGIGIDENHLPYVFDRYKKLDSEKNNQSGSGLGLAIVKRILELHQIAIQVESKKNEGTTFFFKLPDQTQKKPK
jgi:signal transduction histidine kinase